MESAAKIPLHFEFVKIQGIQVPLWILQLFLLI